MDRKTFLKKSIAAMLFTIPAYALLNCSSDDGGNTVNPPVGNPGDCLQNGGTASAITGNHGHSLSVSAADVSAGTEKTYSIQGASSHQHMVTVTSSDFGNLGLNQSITKTSTSDSGHTHSVTISCA